MMWTFWPRSSSALGLDMILYDLGAYFYVTETFLNVFWPVSYWSSVRAGPAQKRIKRKVESRQPLQIRLENWKHWPWRNSACAGPNSLRIRIELAEISKKTRNYRFLATFLAYKICLTAPKIVVPDQSEQWYTQQSWRRKETIDISCTAQFLTHHEIWPKNCSYTLSK